MSVDHAIDPANADAIRQVLIDVEHALQALDLDDCDRADLQEVVARVATELDSPHPNAATLTTYLNSIARSLRSTPSAQTVVMELDAAMRAAQLPRSWEY